MEAKLQRLEALGPKPPTMHIHRIWGLAARGEDFVRNADAVEGKCWKKAKARCAKAGVDATTSSLAQTMPSMIQAALASES